MTDSILTPTANTKQDDITPGLLNVLQTIVALRFVLELLGGGFIAFMIRYVIQQRPSNDIQAIAFFTMADSLLLLGFVFWPWVRERFGSFFLPVALGWLLITPLLQQVLFLITIPADFLGRTGAEAFGGIGLESIWLAIPIVLAAWQYGRRGWQITIGALVVGSLFLSMLFYVHARETLGPFILISIARLGTITVLGWVVMRLVEALRSEHKALVHANRLLSQRAATVEQLTESRERNRMARELHDTLAHSLTGVSVQLQALETLMKYDPEAAENQLKDTQATVRSGIQESRRAIEALRATPLEDLGLSEALRQLCRRNAERANINYLCEIEEVEALDPLTEQSIYRIAEAAVSNAEQHAAPSEITLHLTCRPHVRLEIRDNGLGFDVDSVPEDRYGLTGMHERAELVGGDLTIESDPGQGTRVLLEIRD